VAAEREALQLIADEFVKTLPGRMIQVRDDWEELNRIAAPENSELPPLLHDFYHQVHNMTGSSGTFGFTQLSQIGRQILNILEPALKAQTPLTREMIQTVGPILAEMEVEARAPVQIEGWL